ncbi:MAG: sugar ABC transporter permease [Phycisphaerae bacterium]|nr:sugar ABC transporter permease [Phycisphaerae bacterium]
MIAGRSRAKALGIALLFVGPNLIGFLVFTSLPVVAAFLLAFTRWDLISPPEYCGLANLQDLIVDDKFWYYLYNTTFLMLGVPLSMFGSMFLAIILARNLPGMWAYRTAFFLPSITAGVGTFILWQWIYSPDFGLANWLIREMGDGMNGVLALAHLPWRVGWEGPRWLQDPAWAKPALIIMGLWGGIGGTNMILYLAALRNIPPELYEAADIDGAGSWARFRNITWPMLTPTTFFIFIMGIIGGFQGGFAMAHVMTLGGPDGSTTTISYYIYQCAYQWYEMGYAAAIALALFVIVLIATLINWKVGERHVHYE